MGCEGWGPIGCEGSIAVTLLGVGGMESRALLVSGVFSSGNLTPLGARKKQYLPRVIMGWGVRVGSHGLAGRWEGRSSTRGGRRRG